MLTLPYDLYLSRCIETSLHSQVLVTSRCCRHLPCQYLYGESTGTVAESLLLCSRSSQKHVGEVSAATTVHTKGTSTKLRTIPSKEACVATAVSETCFQGVAAVRTEGSCAGNLDFQQYGQQLQRFLYVERATPAAVGNGVSHLYCFWDTCIIAPCVLR